MALSHFARYIFMEEMDPETLAFESMVFDLMLIAYRYTIRLLKTWKQASNWPVTASKYLRDSSSSKLKNWSPHYRSRTLKQYLSTNILQPLGIAAFRVMYLQINIFTSYLAEVTSYSNHRPFLAFGTPS